MTLFRKIKELPVNVWVLSVVSFLNDISSEIVYPLLPAFLALTLGASPFAIGAIEGMAESASSILKLFSGYLSDKFERRKFPVVLGYLLAAVTRPWIGFATSWEQVFAVRLVDRFGKGIRGAPRDAILAESVEPERRGIAFGFNRAADNLGSVFGPLTAFFLIWLIAGNAKDLSADDYRNVFLYASFPVILGIFVVLFFVKEKRVQERISKPPLKISFADFDSNFRFYLVTVSVFTLSNSTDAFLLLRATESGVPQMQIPLLWMVLNLSKIIFSIFAGDLSDRIGRKKLILAGWIIYALVYMAFGFVSNEAVTWLLFVIYGAYFGCTEGVEKALVADLVPKERSGTAFGLYNLAIGITVFPASLIFGYIWWVAGAKTAFIVSAAISLIAVAMFLRIKTSAQRQ